MSAQEAISVWQVIAPSLVGAVSGLSGVWLGGWLSSGREARRERAREEKAASYLAILVSAHLSRFVAECLAVARDNGTNQFGELVGRDEHGYEWPEATVELPKLDLLSLDVDWKSLPTSLMYQVLGLGDNHDHLNREIEGVGDASEFPDYSDLFRVRQGGYAKLGMQVLEVIEALRRELDLPPQERSTVHLKSMLRRQVDWADEQRRRLDAATSNHPSP